MSKELWNKRGNTLGVFINYWRMRRVTVAMHPSEPTRVITAGESFRLNDRDCARVSSGQHPHNEPDYTDCVTFYTDEPIDNYKRRIENDDWSPNF